jgi:hypothetical protein
MKQFQLDTCLGLVLSVSVWTLTIKNISMLRIFALDPSPLQMSKYKITELPADQQMIVVLYSVLPSWSVCVSIYMPFMVYLTVLSTAQII